VLLLIVNRNHYNYRPVADSVKLELVGFYGLLALVAAFLPAGYDMAAECALFAPVACFLAVTFYREVLCD
jgi:hypothetical protein